MPKKHTKTIDKTYKEISERPETPFSDDLLGLGDVADSVATIISNTNGPFVFNINSPYGTGKTFFTTRLRVLLERNYGVETLFYNAWEFDFYKNPFVSIISEFNNYFEQPKHSSINI